ncbi:MAG: oxidoreductase [Ferruginibacter sp.]|nr:oxidoreductase [Ferruginibacter sp.]
MQRITKLIFALHVLMLTSTALYSQEIKIISQGTHTSLRGLCPVSDQIIWASGSSGFVGISVDGGTNWRWQQVKGYEKTEFRDIEAFNENTALIMGITEPAVILRTEDAGQTWNLVYSDTSKGCFFDAIDFSDTQNGILIGDPLDGRAYLASTTNGGKSWHHLPPQDRPFLDSGEACFASSGSNIIKMNKKGYVFITGGLTSHFYDGRSRKKLPLLQGRETTGANAIAKNNKNYRVVVGGDFMKMDDTTGVCTFSVNGGKTWQQPEETCHGYRSSVEWIGKNSWVACGLNGVDISNDAAKHFTKISPVGYNVCKISPHGKRVFFAGSNGRIAVMNSKN